MIYKIGNLEFKSKKSCLDFTRNIIISLGCCIINKDHEKYNFFSDLINNHPESKEKIGCGIDYFYIQENVLTKRPTHMMIKRLDNTTIDFSWVYCCEFKKRPHARDLSNAMRYAISNDIKDFRNKSALICSYCKLDTGVELDYHVDHDDPPFRKLKDDFLKENTLKIPTTFASHEYWFLTIFREDDKAFKNSWIDYHNKHCKLQILCKTCNLKKH